MTLFVTTGTIVKDNKNYINWDQIRKLKEEGVTIGAHSHTHAHMPNIELDDPPPNAEPRSEPLPCCIITRITSKTARIIHTICTNKIIIYRVSKKSL